MYGFGLKRATPQTSSLVASLAKGSFESAGLRVKMTETGNDNTLAAELEKRQGPPRLTSHDENDSKQSDSVETERSKRNLLLSLFDLFVAWLTPYEQMMVLRKEVQQHDELWERFRDSLMRKWSSMNIIVSILCTWLSFSLANHNYSL